MPKPLLREALIRKIPVNTRTIHTGTCFTPRELPPFPATLLNDRNRAKACFSRDVYVHTGNGITNIVRNSAGSALPGNFRYGTGAGWGRGRDR